MCKSYWWRIFPTPWVMWNQQFKKGGSWKRNSCKRQERVEFWKRNSNAGIFMGQWTFLYSWVGTFAKTCALLIFFKSSTLIAHGSNSPFPNNLQSLSPIISTVEVLSFKVTEEIIAEYETYSIELHLTKPSIEEGMYLHFIIFPLFSSIRTSKQRRGGAGICRDRCWLAGRILDPASDIVMGNLRPPW